jgi:hypothetical protein
MAFGSGEAPLGRGASLSLVVQHGYRVIAVGDGRSAWRVITTSYAYLVLDRDLRTVVAYHWHPVGLSPVVHPQVHVGCRTPAVDFARAHLPTGHVSLPAVLRAAVTELGVEPWRADWDEVLARAERELGAER